MDKQLIGIFRLAVYIALMFLVDLPSLREYEIWVTEVIHGEYTSELRNSTSVWLVRLISLGIMSFYILQTILYIFVGSALNGRNSGIVNFFRHSFRSIREIANGSHFWTNSSDAGSLNRINDVLKYRDNKMSMMSNSQAAKLMKKTGHIDAIMSQPDLPQSRKALSYLNNKVALMDNKQALEFLQNK